MSRAPWVTSRQLLRALRKLGCRDRAREGIAVHVDGLRRNGRLILTEQGSLPAAHRQHRRLSQHQLAESAAPGWGMGPSVCACGPTLHRHGERALLWPARVLLVWCAVDLREEVVETVGAAVLCEDLLDIGPCVQLLAEVKVGAGSFEQCLLARVGAE